MTARQFDVARVRGLYPTVGMGTAYLDGTYSALHPESVIRSIIATLRAEPAQPGGGSVRSQRSARAADAARQAVADLVGGEPGSVVFGHGYRSLQLPFADILSAGWHFADEIVLNRADCDSLVWPWLRAARQSGAVVRWAEVDLETGELPSWQYEQLIGPRTRLVTVPLANPGTGTVPDVAAIAAHAHAQGALVVGEAGAAVNYLPIDLAALGTDLLAVSAATFGGPTVSAMVARPGLLSEMDERPPSRSHPEFEPGPLAVELLSGVTAAVDHLAGLEQTATGSRRERLATSITASSVHTAELWQRLRAGLDDLAHISVLGGRRRLPVLAFTAAGHTPAQLGAALARRKVSVWTGPAELTRLMDAFGADELGGAAFAGLLAHTSAAEVDQLLDALARLKP